MYDTVTLIGMDNAIIDIVSLVTILHDRKIGVHDGKFTSLLVAANINVYM